MQILQSCTYSNEGLTGGPTGMARCTKKGRSRYERPKSREETPKWATVDIRITDTTAHLTYELVRRVQQLEWRFCLVLGVDM